MDFNYWWLRIMKNNVLLNLIKHQWTDIGKMYKDPFQSKYQLLANRREKVRIQILKDPKALTEYSQTVDGVYEN